MTCVLCGRDAGPSGIAVCDRCIERASWPWYARLADWMADNGERMVRALRGGRGNG